ncbi:MAG TPA: urate hydroxylase PuuD [Rhizomicrobium sp.]|nr:urate hydroxylase PuuD [Rhizomicrobium sp.]
MAAFLSNLRSVVIAGFVLAGLVLVVHMSKEGWVLDKTFWLFFVRWLHIVSGVMWIGLLWYFNFVSTPTTPKIPEELRPALGKFITPAALFWFRWGAMSTIVFGIILAWMNGYLVPAYTLNSLVPDGSFANTSTLMIGIGMWLGTIMWFNVWFVIWPNQQKALNIANKYPDLSKEAKAASAKTAGQFSRINTLLSIPMLFCMAAATHWP